MDVFCYSSYYKAPFLEKDRQVFVGQVTDPFAHKYMQWEVACLCDTCNDCSQCDCSKVCGECIQQYGDYYKETVALQKQAWFSLLNAEQMSVVTEIFKLRQLTDTIGSRVNIPKEFESFEVG